MAEQRRLVDTIAAGIKKYARSHNGKAVRSCRVKIGERASVTPELMKLFFTRASDRTGLHDVHLDVEIVPLLGECEKCNKIVEVDSVLCCKSCGSLHVQLCDHGVVLIDTCEFA